jgi:hypothetical protein
MSSSQRSHSAYGVRSTDGGASRSNHPDPSAAMLSVAERPKDPVVRGGLARQKARAMLAQTRDVVVEILGRSEAQTTVHDQKNPELRWEDELDIVPVTHAALRKEQIASANTFPCTMTSVRCPPGRPTSQRPGMFWSSAASLAGTIRSRRAVTNLGVRHSHLSTSLPGLRQCRHRQLGDGANLVSLPVPPCGRSVRTSWSGIRC